MLNRYLWQVVPNINKIIQVLPAYIHTLPFLSLPPWQESKPDFPPAFELFEKYIKYKLNLIKYSPGVIYIRLGDYVSDEDILRNIYAYVAAAFGRLNNKYGYLYDVIDQGYDYKQKAIPVSQTNASTNYHTDSTSALYVPDIVGLMCLRPALSGGLSLVANAANLALFMQKKYPEHYRTLQQPIIRDVITPGFEKSVDRILQNKFPIFSNDHDAIFHFRYMRYWIETGHQKADIDMDPILIEAMNIIDQYFNDEKNVLSVDLKKGDILFINNSFLAHNRTAFTDSEDPEERRCLVRTWINW